MIKIGKSDVSKFTLVTTPSRTFISGANVTGSVKLFPRLSTTFKDTSNNSEFVKDNQFEQIVKNLQDNCRAKVNAGGDILQIFENFEEKIRELPNKSNTEIDIVRFNPPNDYNTNFVKKRHIKNYLMNWYKSKYSHCKWAYSNYNSLHFYSDVTGTNIPKSSVLIYPNATSTVEMPSNTFSGSYCLSGAFSFDFRIKPHYRTLDANGHYKAGTIMHLSSCYAVTLHTGSSRGVDGLPSGFRIALQLSHSADILPSKINSANNAHPHDLVFFSNDNSIVPDAWNHVIIRWGGNNIHDGSGSFVINSINEGYFNVTQSTVNPIANVNNPYALCIGNFYEGKNTGLNDTSLFFDFDNSQRDGVLKMTDNTGTGWDGPDNYSFNHPLRAELHEIILRRYFIDDIEISVSQSSGLSLSDLSNDDISLYIPPFFIENSPVRRVVNDRGGILQTPLYAIDGTTDDPINVAIALGVGGHYVNLENFVKDFATGRFPRLLSLSGTAGAYTSEFLTSNEIFSNQGGVIKRNYTILPCDDGNFDPNYEILTNERLFNPVMHGSNYDLSMINLDNLIGTASIMSGGIGPSIQNSIKTDLFGPSPEFAGLAPGLAQTSFALAVSKSLSNSLNDEAFNRGIQKGSPLTIYNRTGDGSSNNIVIFDISNIFFGTRILPGSIVIADNNLSGTAGTVGIELRDNGTGNIFRSNTTSKWSKYSNVGNVFYDEGLIVIKSPHLFNFGKNGYTMSFKGVNPVYVTKYEIIADAGHFNSSSHMDINAKPTGNSRDDEKFVYVSGVNLHDKNLNIIAKAKFAQPIIKRDSSRIMFRLEIDQ